MLALVSLKPCFFSRLRRGEIGIHHHIAGAYLLRYAQESSWREDNRRVSNGDQVNPVAKFRSSQAAIDLIARGEFVENAIRKDFVPSEIEAIRRAMLPVSRKRPICRREACRSSC